MAVSFSKDFFWGEFESYFVQSSATLHTAKAMLCPARLEVLEHHWYSLVLFPAISTLRGSEKDDCSQALKSNRLWAWSTKF